MPIKGLEKGDGVPSSPCGLRRDKLGKRERTFPQKGFSLFHKAPISTFIGNKAFGKNENPADLKSASFRNITEI